MAFAAFVEHKLNNDPSEKCEKLILVCAPLKVLISYDWGERKKNIALRRRGWRENLPGSRQLWRELRLYAPICPENASTSYLFLVGKHAVCWSGGVFSRI